MWNCTAGCTTPLASVAVASIDIASVDAAFSVRGDFVSSSLSVFIERWGETCFSDNIPVAPKAPFAPRLKQYSGRAALSPPVCSPVIGFCFVPFALMLMHNAVYRGEKPLPAQRTRPGGVTRPPHPPPPTVVSGTSFQGHCPSKPLAQTGWIDGRGHGSHRWKLE